MSETKERSVIKSITWRVCASITTMILIFIFTGNYVIMVSVGFFEIISKMIIYYIHERTWNKIKWGAI